MKIEFVSELARIVAANSLTELEISEGDMKIRIARAPECQLQPAPAAAPAAAAPIAPIEPDPEPGVDFNRATDIKSSLIGVFYAASSPDAKPYVTVGSKVQKGDVLCIIEAMKLMNEIVAEQSGEIVDVCVQNGDIVEFGQTLFKIC